jgi:WD40 repeat protein
MQKVRQQLRTSGEQVFDLQFHPTANVVAVATITGLVEVLHFRTGEANEAAAPSGPALSVKLYDASCRGLLFSEDGETLFTVSSDKSLKAINGAGIVMLDVPAAHDSSINKIISVDGIGANPIIVTGDDVGRVNAWDFRAGNTPVMTWKLHDDYISDFCYHSDSSTLLSTAGDACLGVYDFKKAQNCVKSFAQESELMSVEVIKKGRKVVCGTDDGTMLVFSWGRWEDCSDRYPGHPESIDDILKIDENSVFTGSSDGKIRAVSVHPNKVLGVVGDHGYFPVEGLRRSKNGRILGTFSHDNKVRLWDISVFAEDVDDAVDDENGMVGDAQDGDDDAHDTADMEEADGNEWDDVSDDDEDDDGADSDSDSDDSDDSGSDSEAVKTKAVKNKGKSKAAAGAGASGDKANKGGKGGKGKGGRGFYDDM